MKTLKDLFLDRLEERYDSTKRLVMIIPKIESCLTYPDFKELLNIYVDDMNDRLSELGNLIKSFEEPFKGVKSHSMVGILVEANTILTDYKGSNLINKAFISFFQKVKSGEASSYQFLIQLATEMEHTAAVKFFQKILDAEAKSDGLFDKLSKGETGFQYSKEERRYNCIKQVAEIMKKQNPKDS